MFPFIVFRVFAVIENGKLFYTNVVGDDYRVTYSNWKYCICVKRISVL